MLKGNPQHLELDSIFMLKHRSVSVCVGEAPKLLLESVKN